MLLVEQCNNRLPIKKGRLRYWVSQVAPMLKKDSIPAKAQSGALWKIFQRPSNRMFESKKAIY